MAGKRRGKRRGRDDGGSQQRTEASGGSPRQERLDPECEGKPDQITDSDTLDDEKYLLL